MVGRIPSSGFAKEPRCLALAGRWQPGLGETDWKTDWKTEDGAEEKTNLAGSWQPGLGEEEDQDWSRIGRPGLEDEPRISFIQLLFLVFTLD